jgi:hypothetical protein
VRALGLPDGQPDQNGNWNGPIPQWNDALDQTAENVAAGLEYAALVWEQEHQAHGEALVADGPHELSEPRKP